jgi:hypothetical protein
MRKQNNRQRRNVAGPSSRRGELGLEQRISVAGSRRSDEIAAAIGRGSNLRRVRGILAARSLLKLLKAENDELRNSVVELALEIQELEIQDMREGQ